MRVGQNPAKASTNVEKPLRITVAVLNYIPFISGYYSDSLEVLKVCLDSARKDPGLPFDLLVFDNGSCSEVQNWLITEQSSGRIQYLYLSNKNLGKGGAWNQIFGGAPGELIVYSDSDVLYSPNWLARSVEILESFPNVGMVTARPFRTRERLYSHTIDWGLKTPEVLVEEGQFIPWKTFEEFNTSLGVGKDEISSVYKMTKDYKITYHGITAMAGASHWQFTTKKEVISKFIPFDMDRPMGQVLQLDELMNASGYLRLMISDPLAMNMSNRLPEGLQSKKSSVRTTGQTFIKKVLAIHLLKGFLMRIYNQIFDWYNN